MKKYIAPIFLLIIFSVFTLRGTLLIDPDFGYRIKTGQIILRQGFPQTDPYSYTMPSFPYVEHAWLVAIFWAWLFPLVKQTGLSLINTTLAISALIIAISSVEKLAKTQVVNGISKPFWFLGSFVFVLALSTLLPFFGVRAQVFSWFLVALLIKVIFDNTLWEKWKIALPVYFFLWANIHGSFLAGLLIVGFVLFTKSFKLKKINFVDFTLLLLSFLTTLINPYRFGIWREALSSVTDVELNRQIAEWMPTVLMFDFSIVIFTTLSVILVFKYRKKIPLEEVLLFFIIFFPAQFSRRHFPLWVIIALPITLKALYFLYQEIKPIFLAKERFAKMVFFFWIGSLIIFLLQAILMIKSAYKLTESKFYPQEAVAFLKQNSPQGQVFSTYEWGGYLIWHYPQKKVFIDGRMPSWQQDSPRKGESGNAFQDFVGIVNGEVDYQSVFDDYQVDTVLWPVNGKRVYSSFFEWLATKLTGLLGEKQDRFFLLTSLEEKGFGKIYQDQVAIIYQKIN